MSTPERHLRPVPTTTRIPPHNLDAEAALLGSMLLDRRAADIALEDCTADDFYKPAHGHIFDAINSLDRRGEPADPITVADELRRNQLLDAVGGPDILTDLVAATAFTGNAHHYATIVSDLARLRRMIGAAAEIIELGYNPTGDVDATIDRAEQLVFDVAQHRHARALPTLGETLTDYLDHLYAMYERGDPYGVPWGLHDLDELTLGLHPKQLVTAAGRPGMGKTDFATNVAVNAAVAGHPTLFVSREMSLAELQMRWVTAQAMLRRENVRRGQFAPNDWPRVSQALADLEHLPLHVDDTDARDVLGVRRAARKIARRWGRVGLVVVDYVQLLEAKTRSENRQVEVAEMSRGLKLLAMELDVPVLMLSQLNRNLEMRADKRPLLSDLRESGALENDSDVVILMYRDEVYNQKTEDRGICELHVAKQRNGPTDTVRVAYNAAIGRFMNMARV